MGGRKMRKESACSPVDRISTLQSSGPDVALIATFQRQAAVKNLVAGGACSLPSPRGQPSRKSGRPKQPLGVWKDPRGPSP